MKLGVVVFLGLLSSGCSLFQQPVVQESYFVPVIRSDVSTSGYVPSVTLWCHLSLTKKDLDFTRLFYAKKRLAYSSGLKPK